MNKPTVTVTPDDGGHDNTISVAGVKQTAYEPNDKYEHYDDSDFLYHAIERIAELEAERDKLLKDLEEALCYKGQVPSAYYLVLEVKLMREERDQLREQNAALEAECDQLREQNAAIQQEVIKTFKVIGFEEYQIKDLTPLHNEVAGLLHVIEGDRARIRAEILRKLADDLLKAELQSNLSPGDSTPLDEVELVSMWDASQCADWIREQAEGGDS